MIPPLHGLEQNLKPWLLSGLQQNSATANGWLLIREKSERLYCVHF